MSGIQRVDFIGIPSRNAERSRAFYVETLGLRPDDKSRFEVWAGETCFGEIVQVAEDRRIVKAFGDEDLGEVGVGQR